jgi:hypothetical protein
MQRAVFIQPKAEPFFAHDSFAPRVVIHGAGAALFDCFVAAGVGFHGVPLISLLIVLSGVLARCSLLCMVFFFSSLMFCSCYSGTAYGGKSASSQADT